jgi:predicted O-methyltransferase YrrM
MSKEHKKSDRSTLPYLFEAMGFKRGVEVGVYEGVFSKCILEKTSIDELHGIDPWVNTAGEFEEATYKMAKTVLQPFGKRCMLHIAPSPVAAEMFDDESLDFVYIDGDHSYEATLKDIKAWTPKVKKGGIVAGHDYADKGNAVCRKFVVEEKDQRQKEVKKAVREFISNNPYVLNVTMEQACAWWFVKRDITK